MNKGFTLIEMLVVVAIIGLLSSVVLVGLGDIRRNARDTRRIIDLRQIQNLLEIHYARDGFYPEDIYATAPNVPYDPVAPVDPLTAEPVLNPYGYRLVGSDGQGYVLGACLEGNRSRDLAHAHIKDDLLVIRNFGECKCRGNLLPEKDNKVYCTGVVD